MIRHAYYFLSFFLQHVTVEKMRICFFLLKSVSESSIFSNPKSKINTKNDYNWLFVAVVVISPVLVGIDVRMIFCLIFKWFTLFSCKLPRNKLVLILLSTVLHLHLLFTSLLLTTDKFYFTFFCLHFTLTH